MPRIPNPCDKFSFREPFLSILVGEVKIVKSEDTQRDGFSYCQVDIERGGLFLRRVRPNFIDEGAISRLKKNRLRHGTLAVLLDRRDAYCRDKSRVQQKSRASNVADEHNDSEGPCSEHLASVEKK